MPSACFDAEARRREATVEKISRSALVPYTNREMFALVSDIESYPEFLPWCTEARVLSHEHDEVRASIGFSVGGMTRTFATRNYQQVNKMIEMRLEEGPFRHLQGYWRFDPLGDQGCKVSMDMEFEFSNTMLRLVVGPVFSQLSNSLVDSFQQRAVQVYGRR